MLRDRIAEIRAFTLVEVLIGIVISSIIIAFCYAGLVLFKSYFINIERRGKAYQEALLLQEHLSSNWDQSIYIWETNRGLSFEGDSLSTWMFEDSIVRVNERFYFHFEKVLLRTYSKAWKAENYLIDSIYLTIRFSRSDSLNLFFQKKYPPAISIESYGDID